MNLDYPIRLYPQTKKSEGEDFADVYVTEDERWLLFRNGHSWTLADRSSDRGPKLMPSINACVCEIKEVLTGRSYHRHTPRIVVPG